LIELVTERDRGRYVTRTLDGAGKGSEIWTRVSTASRAERPLEHGETGIEVEFHVPDLPGLDRDSLGAGYTALYTRLWDEDESMMRQRQARIDERRRDAGGEGSAILELGPEDRVRARLPLTVDLGGRSFRVVALDGELVVHSAVCPHWLGPLEATPDSAGHVTCPWHGYRFDVRSGRSCDGRALKLSRPPRVEIDAHRMVRLTAA
jgi:nitrite reductase/ring-hydroxylating ferredoxin subunit